MQMIPVNKMHKIKCIQIDKYNGELSVSLYTIYTQYVICIILHKHIAYFSVLYNFQNLMSTIINESVITGMM